MRDVVSRLAEMLVAERSVAYCRLVETRGSTPQKAGAVMLVHPSGAQDGTLGGGCVEAEVKRRALQVLHDGRALIATFQLDHDYGWDDGLICGGRMRVLIEPIGSEPSRRYFQQWVTLAERDRGWMEAIVFDSTASGIEAPASFLLDESGGVVATLHHEGATLPPPLRDPPPATSPRTRPLTRQGVSFLPVSRRCRLIIVGGGHVGKAVADLAVDLDFEVWVIDDRGEYVSEDRFPRARRRLSGDLDRILPEVEVTPDTYCLIVTRGHQHDQRALYHLAEREACYVGMIGSKRKIKLIFDNLLAEGISAEALGRVFAPLGIDIGSQTVAEIAISICAELVAHRNKDGQVPGRTSSPARSLSPSNLGP